MIFRVNVGKYSIHGAFGCIWDMGWLKQTEREISPSFQRFRQIRCPIWVQELCNDHLILYAYTQPKFPSSSKFRGVNHQIQQLLLQQGKHLKHLQKPWQALASLGISNHLSTEAAFSKWQAAAFIAGPKPSLVTGLGVPLCQVDQVPHVMCCSMGVQNSRCDGQVRILGKQRCRSWDLLLIKLFTTPSPEIYHKGLQYKPSKYINIYGFIKLLYQYENKTLQRVMENPLDPSKT